MFGTFGYRDIAGTRINTFVASLITQSYYDAYHPGKVTVASDTRRSSEALRLSVISALIERGAEVHDLGTVPTPVAQHYTRHNTDGGIIITASHNPPEYNGIKLIDQNGIGIPKEDTARVVENINKFILSISASKTINDALINTVNFTSKNNYNGRIIQANPVPEYQRSITSFIHEKLTGLKIVFDASNATARQIIPDVLRKLGAKVLTVNSDLDPDFTWRNPEPSEENIKYLSDVVKAVKADFAIAVDGDADRAVFIDEKGNYVHGDKTFALVADAVLKWYEEKKITGYDKKIVTTVATSDAVKEIAEKHGAEIIVTKVGDPYVSRTILRENALLGGEENGGVMFPWHVLGRDSGMTTAVVAKIVHTEKELGYTFSDTIKGLPTYYQIKKKYNRRVNYDEVKQLLEKLGMEYDDTDGVKIKTKLGWVLIRNSGTEPVVRIFAEAKNREDLEKLIDLSTEILSHLTRP